MSDDSPRFHRQLAGLATDWVRAKRRNLERGRPNTKTDSGGTVSQYSFDGQELNRNELRKVRDIRKSGGIVASLFNKKALMRFGGGAELQSDNDDLEEWLGETYQRLDLIVLDLGLDATWFPYGLGEPAVETRSGEFSHVEFVEPWTTLPKTSEYGEILAWEQETQDGSTQVFDPEEIGSIVVNKAAARDKVGVSEVLRNEEEITQYKENQRAVDKAVEIAGFPHHVWTVGAEGRSPVDDNDLRRVRNLIDNMDGDTQFVVGPDVEHDKITPTDFDFQSITKRDLRILTTAIGLPFEVAGYGREGMGSGSETELIGKMHSLENQVARRRFETQFVEEFVRPVVEQYSPYDPEEHINLEISPFHDESEDVASLIEKIGDYMSNAEVRDRLDLPPLEDDDMAESYRPPQQIEEAEEGDEQQDPMGGLFGEAIEAELDKRDLMDPMINGHDLDPETGIGTCGSTGEEIEAELMSDLEEDCPHCDEPLSVFATDAELADGDSGNSNLAGEHTPEWDRHYLRMLEGTAWGESDRALLAGSGVPEMVQDRLRESIMAGNIFTEFDTIPSSELMQLREYMTETLTDDGWTTDGLADQLMQLDGVNSRDKAETIARTETASIVNSAREDAYEERELDDARFEWVGTSDHRTTEACTWLKEQTDGGVPMDRLKELIAEAPSHDPDMQDNLARPDNFVVHPNERHTFTRVVE